MENKMTAVEWLKENLPSLFQDDSGHYQKLFEQANKMFEEQMIDAYDYGYTEGWHMEEHKSEEYYQENYGK